MLLSLPASLAVDDSSCRPSPTKKAWVHAFFGSGPWAYRSVMHCLNKCWTSWSLAMPNLTLVKAMFCRVHPLLDWDRMRSTICHRCGALLARCVRRANPSSTQGQGDSSCPPYSPGAIIAGEVWGGFPFGHGCVSGRRRSGTCSSRARNGVACHPVALQPIQGHQKLVRCHLHGHHVCRRRIFLIPSTGSLGFSVLYSGCSPLRLWAWVLVQH